jgi:hypothetical protein
MAINLHPEPKWLVLFAGFMSRTVDSENLPVAVNKKVGIGKDNAISVLVSKG